MLELNTCTSYTLYTPLPSLLGVEPSVSPTSGKHTIELRPQPYRQRGSCHVAHELLILLPQPLENGITSVSHRVRLLVPITIFHSLSGLFLVPTRCSSCGRISHFLSAPTLGLLLKWGHTLSPLLTAQQANLQGSCCLWRRHLLLKFNDNHLYLQPLSIYKVLFYPLSLLILPASVRRKCVFLYFTNEENKTLKSSIRT